MKALGLVRISKKTNSVRILDEIIWAEKYREHFSKFLFCKYVISIVNISIVVKYFMVD